MKSNDKKVNDILKKNKIKSNLIKKKINLHNRYQNNSLGNIELEDYEHSLQFRNKDFLDALPNVTKNKIFDLDLEFGKYSVDINRNGNELLIGSSQGHVAMMEWKNKKLVCEFNVKETIRDVKFLSNINFYGIAQKDNAYIYDSQGLELHEMSNIQEPTHLEYLNYHYLLVALTKRGKLIYQDISTGNVVSEIKTKNNEYNDMKKNNYNGLIGLSNSRGVVSLYTPNLGKYVYKVLAQQASCSSLDFTLCGNYMITTGTESSFKIWDLRMMKELYNFWTPKSCHKVSISQNDMLAISYGTEVMLWSNWKNSKPKNPYLRHNTKNRKFINDIMFAPYEDFLITGLNGGIETFITPGSGESNFDTFEENIFNIKKQKREAEVHKLLEKLSPTTITNNPYKIGTIDHKSKEILEKEKEEERLKKFKNDIKMKKKKKKKKHRSNIDEIDKDNKREALNREIIRNNIKKKKLVQNAQNKKINSEIDILENADNEIINITKKIMKKHVDIENIE